MGLLAHVSGWLSSSKGSHLLGLSGFVGTGHTGLRGRQWLSLVHLRVQEPWKGARIL